MAVGYFVPEERGALHLYMYCQADPKEYTQGFKLAVEWANGSMIFVEDGKTTDSKELHFCSWEQVEFR